MGFIDQMRAEGHAVGSIIRVLREQGVKVAARTYRAWRRGRVSARTVTDAMVVDAVRDAAWRVETLPNGTARRGCMSRSSSTCSRNASWPGTRRPASTSTW